MAMQEVKEVKELRGKILGMEMELNILARDLDRLKSELVYNSKMQKEIEENIHFLRTSDVIVSLAEYRKIKQQKTLIDQRVIYYKSKIRPLEQIVDRKENFIKEEMDVFEKIYRTQFISNVLEFPYVGRKKA